MSQYLDKASVLPVLTVTDVDMAIALSDALQRGGINAVEITLRTDAGLEALSAVKKALPSMIVAAGTVNTPEAMDAVAKAGVDFAVSPGMTANLVKHAAAIDLPFLPGVATPSDVLQGAELGLENFKLFPAAAVGGLALLKSMAAPLADFRFCPTGGLTQDNFSEYLSLPNVVCVGGSWMVPASLLEKKAWGEITQLASETSNIVKSLN
ncbi:MAG: bifunctional 4-hydroxy-2-oxoglutarate aldolase/2-dehydro-3-deoxy-phosphogluconate aldolase [Spongiibacteraceae bacterium]|nr:bifunctional 4-hydroxy-2-oxoglutarate aldolase/2-dehydro-3-deoxy-phosphogluconate aldolase [Spongiibacteraceae bacterium]